MRVLVTLPGECFPGIYKFFLSFKDNKLICNCFHKVVAILVYFIGICFSFYCWCYIPDVNNLGSFFRLLTLLLFYRFDHEVAVQFSCSILSCIEATVNCYHYSSCSYFLAPRFAELLDKFNPLLSLYTLTALHRLNL